MSSPSLTGRTLNFDPAEIIVSKTDPRGVITYVNDVFVRVSGYSEAELLGAPHRILRHPQMPRGVFKLLWDTIKDGREMFAYVLNRAKTGDEYWVFAHVTASYDSARRVIGYHSNRRAVYADALPRVRALYARLLEAERRVAGAAEQARAGQAELLNLLRTEGCDYDEFVFNLSRETRLPELTA
jgi:PAS domain S-box-containing protein